MLPFLKAAAARNQGGSASQHITSEGQVKPGDSPDMGLQSAAEDLIKAIESKDASQVADALRAAFYIIGGQE